MKETCHSPPLGKIQGIKPISQPPLMIGIYTFWKIMSTGDGRKLTIPSPSLCIMYD
jgi:hypothetical protein